MSAAVDLETYVPRVDHQYDPRDPQVALYVDEVSVRFGGALANLLVERDERRVVFVHRLQLVNRRDDRQCSSRVAGSSGASDAMHVIFRR